jgi:hypothetical protein
VSSLESRRDLLCHAARRHGVFTFDEWTAHGLSPNQLARDVKRGSIERIHPSVYRVAGSPATWRAEVMAAVAGAGPHALVSHRSAAAMWSLAGVSGRTIDVTVPRHLRVRRRGAIVHECLDLPSQDHSEIDGIPVTGIHRTLLDVCRYAVPERAGDQLDDAVRRNLTSYLATATWLEGVARQGVRGVRRLRGLLAERPGGTVPPGSTFEAQALRVLAHHGLPEPSRQVKVVCGAHVFSIDFGWPDALVGIEADGREFHTLTSQIEHDHWRQNLIQLEGWLLLRYTPTALRTRPRQSADEIRVALFQRSS